MLNQAQETAVKLLIEKLNSAGIHVDVETVKQAITKYPQLVQQIESILSASTSQEKIEKIKTLITKAARGEVFTKDTETSSK